MVFELQKLKIGATDGLALPLEFLDQGSLTSLFAIPDSYSSKFYST